MEINDNEELLAQEVDSSMWWVIGDKNVVLGCGSLSGTWLPNKELLYQITLSQFQTEAQCYGVNAIDCRNTKNSNREFNFNEFLTKEAMLLETMKKYNKLLYNKYYGAKYFQKNETQKKRKKRRPE